MQLNGSCFLYERMKKKRENKRGSKRDTKKTSIETAWGKNGVRHE